MSKYINLFKPGLIGNLRVENRVVFAPMVTDYVLSDGYITDRLINYYAERAKGGTGLIIIESTAVHVPPPPHRLWITSDKYIPGFRRLVQSIHKYNVKVICQVNPHRGRADKADPASASVVPHPFTGVVPRQLTVADIYKIQGEFKDGVRRATEAGFDGVMIHGATGYLVAEFLSPRTNLRTDEYGGEVRNRARFAIELVNIAKQVAGPNYPVTFRMMASERIPGGLDIADAIEICKLLQEAGIAAIHLTAGAQETPEYSCPPGYMQAACNADISEAVKKELKIPVSIAGKINSPDVAEDILRAGKADFVDLGRALLADPYFVNKTRNGNTDEIRKCICCQRCSVGTIQQLIPLRCTVNPAAGREREFDLLLSKHISKGKKVLVIGGGAGGMQAALIAAQRGHDVTLWEQEDKLGGQLNVAAIPPGKGDLNNLLVYLPMQMQKYKVKTKLLTTATVESVIKFRPDAVIVAVGSALFTPDIPGIHNKSVLDSRQVLSGKVQVGDRVIVIGGGEIGCEIADYLADKCKEITLIFRKESPMAGDLVDWSVQKVLLERLKQRNIRIIAGVKEYKVITHDGLKYVDKEGSETTLIAENIILATGAKPVTNLAKLLVNKVSEVYEVGDCVEARQLLESIHEGTEAALSI